MAKRSGWNQLSDSYRNRLQKKGITESAYTSGKSLESARGHATTPEHARATLRIMGRTVSTRTYAGLAARAGIIDILPNFDALTRGEQNRVGKLYIKSFFEKGTGELLTKPERAKRGLLPQDRRVARHAGDEQINGRMEFQEFVDTEREKPWNDGEDWESFRSAYATFSSS
jgi:hypothetical protein